MERPGHDPHAGMLNPENKDGWGAQNWKWFLPAGCLGALLILTVLGALSTAVVMNIVNSSEAGRKARTHAVQSRAYEAGHQQGNQATMGSHWVVIRPISTRTGSGSGVVIGKPTRHTYWNGATTVRIDQAVLFVNNVDYGELSEGEPILVDHGEVFVSGQRRSGTALPAEKLEPMYRTPEDVSTWTHEATE